MATVLQKKQTARRLSARREYREVNRLRIGLEKTFTFRLIRLFSEIGNQAASAVESGGSVALSAIFPDVRSNLERVINQLYEQTIKTFSDRAIANRRNSKAIASFEDLYTSFIRTQGAERVQGITVTTQRIIQRVIEENQTAGNAVIGRAIRERFEPRFSRSRAATIARTEVHNAASYATHEQQKSFGVPAMRKQWVANTDERTRANHIAVSGTNLPMDEDFVVGGKKMAYPSDPRGGAAEVINCRCVLIYVEPEEEIQEGSTQQEPVTEITNNLYGGTTKSEKLFHDAGGWDTKSLVFKAVFRTRPVEVINVRSRGFYSNRGSYSKESPVVINMNTTEKKLFEDGKLGLREKSTWRHEYGHHIDYMMGGYLRGNGKTIGISSEVADDILIDRKLHSTPNKKKIEKQAEKNMIAFLKSKGLDLDTEDFLQRPSYQTYDQQLKLLATREDLNQSDGLSSYRRFFENLEIDENFVNDALKGSGFDFNDINIIFGDGKFGGGRSLPIRRGTTGVEGLLKTVNASRQTKLDFSIFLNDLKSNRARAGQAGWNGWIEKYGHHAEGDYLNDYLEAMSNAAIGEGHGKGYYKKFVTLKRGVTMAHTTEMMANYTALLGTDAKRASVYKKLMLLAAPKSTKKFDDIFEEIVEAERMPDDFNY